MSDTPTRFPAFAEPATKGDVLMAMAWTQALVLNAVQVAVAASSGDTAALVKAHEQYIAEQSEFRQKMLEIGGSKA